MFLAFYIKLFFSSKWSTFNKSLKFLNGRHNSGLEMPVKFTALSLLSESLTEKCELKNK